jgi:hypothetical protein
MRLNGFLIALVVFVLCGPAEAQQATKISRIGYLIASSPTTTPARIEAFRQGLRELGYVEGKNVVIEYRYAEGKLDHLPALAAELVHLKVDVIVTSAAVATPSCQGNNCYDSDCHGAGWRSCWFGARREPCASGWQHYWIVQPFAGDKRKTTGTSEGDRSQVLPRGRTRDFNQPGLRTRITGDGTRRTRVRGAASVPRHSRSQGY